MSPSNKVTDPATAVRQHVRPGMCVHFSFTHNRSHALAWELARAFRDTRSLRLAATGLLDYAVVLAGAGALASAESGFAGLTYPSPAPAASLGPTVGAMDSDPHWTNLTVTMRLMAGALGLPAIPTRSLWGTDLGVGPGRANGRDPFTGEQMLLLAPLRPDVAFVHVPIADTAGNAFVQGPFGEDLWGAWAARSVIVSAERIIESEEMRAMAPSPGFPGYRVDAVVDAPFGAHPQAQYVWDDRMGGRSYAEDYAFRSELRRVQRDSDALNEWLHRWIFTPTNHEEYLDMLGTDRLAGLEQQATGTFRPPVGAASGSPPTAEERAASTATTRVVEGAHAGAIDMVFAGIGLSHLAGWTAMELLRGSEVAPTLVAETGMVDFSPVPGDPYLFNFPNTRSAVVHDGFLRLLGGLHTSPGRSLALLSAGQVDCRGKVNSSQDAAGGYIVGSGGANDVAAADIEMLLVMPLTPERTPADLPFTTSRPRRLAGLACDFGLLEPDHRGELVLTAVLAEPASVDETVRAAAGRCGWELEVSPQLRRLPPPSKWELDTLRSYDPQRALLGREGWTGLDSNRVGTS